MCDTRARSCSPIGVVVTIVVPARPIRDLRLRPLLAQETNSKRLQRVYRVLSGGNLEILYIAERVPVHDSMVLRVEVVPRRKYFM